MKEFRVIQVEGIYKMYCGVGGHAGSLQTAPMGGLVIKYHSILDLFSPFLGISSCRNTVCVHSSNMVRKCSHRAIVET